MPLTIRKYWGKCQGRATLNFNWDIIDHDSTVIVTASEYADNKVRFIGAASISADNVCPHGPPYEPNHGVTFVVNVSWDSPLNVVTDITVLDAKPIEVQTYVPDVTNRLGVRLQYQQSDQWCWIACGVTVDHFYDPGSTWKQCEVMTQIGQEINGFPTNTSACPSTEALARNPGLAARYANPYAISARYVLDAPLLAIDTRYLKSGGVTDALKKVGNYASYHGPDLTLADLRREIDAGRLVVADIKWFSGGSHEVLIAGIQGEGLLILDPVNGECFTEFGEFPGTYFGGATLNGYALTKP